MWVPWAYQKKNYYRSRWAYTCCYCSKKFFLFSIPKGHTEAVKPTVATVYDLKKACSRYPQLYPQLYPKRPKQFAIPTKQPPKSLYSQTLVSCTANNNSLYNLGLPTITASIALACQTYLSWPANNNDLYKLVQPTITASIILPYQRNTLGLPTITASIILACQQ